MSTRTITATTQAWLSEFSGPDLLQGDALNTVDHLVYHTALGDGVGWKAIGYTYVGEATITVEVQDESAIIEAKVESLKAQKSKVLGDAQAQATKIERQIQQLLAIGYAREVA